MAATAAIAAITIASSSYSAVQANKTKKDAQGAADFQQRQAQGAIDQQKAKEQADLEAKNQNVVLQKQKVDQTNAGGFTSTIATSPTGLANSAVTGGQKTLLGS